MTKKYFRNIFMGLIGLVICLSVSETSLAANQLTVGVYTNPPLQTITENGAPQGLVIDILTEIASQEHWQLTYHACEWEACLTRLEAGEIDLMGAIAYTEARAQRFDFNQETLINNWGQLYARNGKIESLLDLTGQQVAVLQGDIHAEALADLLASFDVAAKLIPFETYTEVFEAIAAGRVDAGVVNHFYATQHQDEYNLNPTPIIFNPIEVRFAATKALHHDTLTTIDEYLAEAKADTNSFYYTALDTWFGGVQPHWQMPWWLSWVALGIIGLGLLFFLSSLVLQHQVNIRTRELTESRAQLNLALRGTDAGLWVWDIVADITVYNSTWAEIFGYPPDEVSTVSGDDWKKFIHPDDRARAEQQLQRHLSRESEQFECEIRIQHHDGHWVWVLDRGRVFQWTSTGEPLRMAGTHLDITQRKRAEAELTYNKELFQALLEQSVEGIGVNNMVGNYILVNASFCKLIGYTEAELLSMNVREIWPEGIEPGLLTKAQPDPSGRHTLKLTRQDGSTFTADISVSSVEVGQQSLLLSVIRDISDRVKNEQALRDSEKRFRNLSEATFEAIFISEDGLCLEQNQAAAKMFGYTNAEAIGKPVTDWIAPEDREQFCENMRTRVEGPYRVTALRKDGSTFPCEIRARTMLYEGRQVRVTALRDITAQINAENALAQRAEELAALLQTSVDIIAPHNLPDLLETIVKRATRLLNGTNGGLYLTDEAQKRVRCVVSYQTAKDYTGTVLNYGEGAAGKVAESGQPLLVDDYRTWDGRANVYADEPFQAIISAPLRWQARIIGVIHVLHDTESRKFTPKDLDLLTSFANQAAVAVENARLYDELQKHATALEARVRDRTAELQIIVNAMSGREIRMSELKDVIRQLRQQLQSAGLEPVADDPLKSKLQTSANK